MIRPDLFERHDDDKEAEPLLIERFTVERETEKALLLKWRRGKFWVPKSLVLERSREVIAIKGWFEPKYLQD